MSNWQVALVREQGVEFAVVCVRDSVVASPHERDRLIAWWSSQLGRPAVVLGERRHQLFGRRDIVNFLSHIDPLCLPWRQMTVAV
jgi:hypothetical protein